MTQKFIFKATCYLLLSDFILCVIQVRMVDLYDVLCLNCFLGQHKLGDAYRYFMMFHPVVFLIIE